MDAPTEENLPRQEKNRRVMRNPHLLAFRGQLGEMLRMQHYGIAEWKQRYEAVERNSIKTFRTNFALLIAIVITIVASGVIGRRNARLHQELAEMERQLQRSQREARDRQQQLDLASHIDPVFIFWDVARSSIKALTNREIDLLDEHFHIPTAPVSLDGTLTIPNDLNIVNNHIYFIRIALDNLQWAGLAANRALHAQDLRLTPEQKAWLNFIVHQAAIYSTNLQPLLRKHYDHMQQCRLPPAETIMIGTPITPPQSATIPSTRVTQPIAHPQQPILHPPNSPAARRPTRPAHVQQQREQPMGNLACFGKF